MKIAVIAIIAVAVIALIVVAKVFLGNPKPVSKSLETYSGDISGYRGEKKLIVAFTASWTGAWLLTEKALSDLDKSKYELRIVDSANELPEIQKFGIKFLPTVALVQNGEITKRVQNLNSIDQIKDW